MTQNGTVNNFPFSVEPLSKTLVRAFTNRISKKNLEKYDLKLQKYLEEDFDGKKFYFTTKDKELKVHFQLKESFKIVEKNTYCREYSQNVEYMSEIISNTGVACRKRKGRWENLVLL